MFALLVLPLTSHPSYLCFMIQVGVVESTGEGVVELTDGDIVIPSDETSRFTGLKGETIYHFLYASSFSEYTVVDIAHLTKIDLAIPPNRACLLSCGVSTGVGAAWRSANVEAGSTVAIFGLGAIGLAAINGMTGGGADYCFECVGLASLVYEAYACCRKKSLFQEHFELFIMITWGIWFNRKNTTFGSHSRNPEEIANFVSEYLMEFKSVHNRIVVQNAEVLASDQKPPTYKANFDGALGSEGAAAIGFVILDRMGDIIATCMERFHNVVEVDHVQALGELQAARFAQYLGLSDLHMEGDSVSIIHAVNSYRKWESLLLIFACWPEVFQNRKYTTHVRRQGNQLGHRLARMALQMDGVEEGPDFIMHLVQQEH
ncbi:zinc-binding alcohol dehydrogenase family protein [Actinidia rufa]|uniref:Zinc-binding alcohol dehydrogenase family protein n=1 Tax=Actinidia rufa TaxID=165716 RepID=A0A7J0GID8_9ERIC|nr:zinc-binding alcohol dehydrogenase family protein [Actinidia rufa]